jgi:hypothetical protein
VTYRIVKVVPYAAPVATLDKVTEQNVNTKGQSGIPEYPKVIRSSNS